MLYNAIETLLLLPCITWEVWIKRRRRRDHPLMVSCICMNKRKIWNIVVFLIVTINWLRMVFFTSKTMLTARGLGSLRYFTVLSNLFEGVACLLWLHNRNEKVKYAAAVSVTLTFVVVIAFLGPLFGYRAMFSGVSFWMHLIVPLASLYEVLFMNREHFDLRDNILAAFPMGMYGIYYLGNNLINGSGEWPYMSDWYGFLRWGYPIGVLFYLGILLVTYLIGWCIRKEKERISFGSKR